MMAENLLYPAQLQNDLNVYIYDQNPSGVDNSELSACAGNAYLFVCEQYVWGETGLYPVRLSAKRGIHDSPQPQAMRSDVNIRSKGESGRLGDKKNS